MDCSECVADINSAKWMNAFYSECKHYICGFFFFLLKGGIYWAKAYTILSVKLLIKIHRSSINLYPHKQCVKFCFFCSLSQNVIKEFDLCHWYLILVLFFIYSFEPSYFLFGWTLPSVPSFWFFFSFFFFLFLGDY